jgi:hypothetical protein
MVRADVLGGATSTRTDSDLQLGAPRFERDDKPVLRKANASAPFESIRNLTELNSTFGDVPRFVTADGCTLLFDSGQAATPLQATRPK